MTHFLDTAIEYLKGVGQVRGDMLRTELGIVRYRDLLNHFPFRYVDRSKIYPIREVNPDFAYVQIKGHFTDYNIKGKAHAYKFRTK